MTPEELDEMLTQTLEDNRLSRGEKKALRERIEEAGPDPHQLAVYRSAAFDAARRAMPSGEARTVLDWLDAVVRLMVPDPDDTGAAQAAALFSPDDHCPRQIGDLFDHARESADVCVFAITDDRIRDAIERAHDRGVAVRILSDNDKSNDPGSDVDYLANRGIPVRLDRSDYHMHHKFAVFDGRCLLTGSYNWTRTAALENEENLVLTTDPRLVRPFIQTFEKLWDEVG